MSAEASSEVVLFVAEGCCPVLQWLDHLPLRVQQKCAAQVWLLQQRHAAMGISNPGPDGAVRHLKIVCEGTHHFLFYSLLESRAVILHGCSGGSIPDPTECKIAESRKTAFQKNPEMHIYTE